MKYLTRMGDGTRVVMTKEELRQDLEEGMLDAVDRGKIPPLTGEDLDRLMEILMHPHRIVSVEPGNEVALVQDAGPLRISADAGCCSGVGVPVSRVVGMMILERVLARDTIELAPVDGSYKPVKPIISMEQQDLENALALTIAPVFYCAMPNPGLYYRPDGCCGNPSELLPQGKIKEACQAQEEAVEYAVRDMVFVGKKLFESGADGMNLDTVGAAGDAEFLATLKAIKEIKKQTNLAFQVGMAGEFIIGIHGGVEFEGNRLAGMYPHQQVKMVEMAGGDIFGPVVNTNTSKSLAWNMGRAVTFVKACVLASNIPVHPNLGMGVCGIPMFETPPIDAVTRISKAMVEVGKADGL